jgi:hypothetical protein
MATSPVGSIDAATRLSAAQSQRLTINHDGHDDHD